MTKVSKRKKIRRNSMAIKPTRICINCKERITGGHFVPPSFGDPGFFICEGSES